MRGGVPAEPYLEMLANTTIASAEQRHNTGVSPSWERRLSAAFIKSRDYGTRASTFLRVGIDNRFEIVERRFGPKGVEGESSFTGDLELATI